ncbi:hypothetical protein [Psychrobacter pulmonis]
MNSILFAHQLSKVWSVESSKSNFSEIQQFRALMRSFSSLKNNFKVEEFHGMKHQVIFNGEGSWGRAPARCEISDLLIISYRKHPTFQARATLLQAKKSNDKHSNLCSTSSNLIPSINFKANLEQWDLLSRRPNVLPHKPFDCRPDILSGAILPSIGSLGVFHKISSKKYDFFYMSADVATPLSFPKYKHAKLKTKPMNSSRNTKGYFECTYASCLMSFAISLYNLEIGTPIEPQRIVSEEDKSYRNMFRGWLKSVLYSHLEITSNESLLTRDLISQLESSYDGELMSEPPSLLIINCD